MRGQKVGILASVLEGIWPTPLFGLIDEQRLGDEKCVTSDKSICAPTLSRLQRPPHKFVAGLVGSGDDNQLNILVFQDTQFLSKMAFKEKSSRRVRMNGAWKVRPAKLVPKTQVPLG